MRDRNEGILLESGTNELEIILFRLGDGSYSINVLKTREIINEMPITKVPNSAKHVEGIIHLRGEIIPVVDLISIVDNERFEKTGKDKFIIAELNEVKVAFRVHDIDRIHRISWEKIEKPDELTGNQPYATGIIKLNNGTLSIFLDIEKILSEINPELAGNLNLSKELGPRERSEKHIIIAEDSSVLRALLKDTMEAAGYSNLNFFQNGKDTWEYLQGLVGDGSVNLKDSVHLLLTDIEMPQMDGHHLTHLVRNDPKLKDIPVVIFSSLITPDLYHKGESVGANAQVSKPRIVELVKEIDHHIL